MKKQFVCKEMDESVLVERYLEIMNEVTESVFVTAKSDLKMLGVTCHECKTSFGLDHSFLDKVSETMFVFTCPYCSAKSMSPFGVENR